MSIKFYRKEDVQKLRFYQVPKVLLEREQYKNLGLAEKLVYGVLLDRTLLSIKNNWFDEEGYAYILFSGETLGDVLNVHKKTARKYINNLKKFGLLEEKRMGRGMSNRIYLVQPDYIENDVYEKKEDENVENNKKEQKVPSRRNEKFPLEGMKSSPSDTDSSDTDFSETINQSQNLSTNKEEEKNEERKKEKNKTNEFKQILENSRYFEFEERYSTAIEQAIRILYFSSKPLKINDIFIPCNQIREDLKRLKWKHLDFALRDFKNQSELQEIRHPAAYLSRCIYNAIFQSELKLEAELKYDGII